MNPSDLFQDEDVREAVMGARTVWGTVAVVGLAGLAFAAGPDESWTARVQSTIATEEYRVTWQPEGYQAPNRAHGFRTRFAPEGIRAFPREVADGETSWEWGLSLHGAGRAGAVRPVGRPTLRVADNRVEYERDAIREWWVNDPRGLEQGFTLAAPPPGPRGEVVLELHLSGTLSAFPTADGQAIDFRTGQGVHVLRYAELHVNDAGGRVLDARMEARVVAENRVIRLVFDDDGASYPITVDPLATTASWTFTGVQADAEVGYSVATAGDVNGDGYSDVVVGARLYDNGQVNEGRAWLYLGSPSGLLPTSSWSAEGNQASAQFGFSVASAGDVNGDGYDDVIVGAYQYDGSLSNEGMAALYLGSSSGLSAAAAWTKLGGVAGAFFGVSVARAGDVNGDGYDDVVVGASAYTAGELREGVAFIYLGSAGGLATAPNYAAQANQAEANLGSSVAPAGDVNGDGYDDIVVGEPFWGAGDQGAAVVYRGSAAGITGAGTAINGLVAGAHFGTSVAGAGDVNGDGYADVIVGAPEFTAGESQEGRISVFFGSATGVATVAGWAIESNQAGAALGASVATAGDVNGDGYADVIVGGPLVDRGQTDEGRAYVYLGSSSGLASVASWVRESDQASALFGHAVATAGDVNGDGYSDVIVGARTYDNGASLDVGRATVYFGGADGLVDSGYTYGNPGDQVGLSAAGAGDVDGDGYSDIIIGAPGVDEDFVDAGLAIVFSGYPTGESSGSSWSLRSEASDTRLGTSVAGAGDVNGDGYGDVIVGAPGESAAGPAGTARVHLGSADGLAETPSWTVQDATAGIRFGWSVATAGDVNGDGYADVVVGAPDWADDGSLGRAYLYLGSASGLATTPAWTMVAPASSEWFGFVVASAGDVNGDGLSDVAVGAPYDNQVFSASGSVFVYLGTPSGLASAAWVRHGDEALANFGHSVAGAGDVNGDGFSDLVVGAPRRGADAGAAYLFLGSTTGLGATASWSVEGGTSDLLATAVSSAGDVNGDGYDDVVVGAPGHDAVSSNLGAAFVYLGSSVGPATDPFLTILEGGEGGVGRSVAPAGDTNGDGFADILIGAVPESASARGVLTFFRGGGGDGADRVLRQVRGNGTTSIALHGKSDSETGFGLRARARTAAGRGRVGLAWEVKPLGATFTGVESGRTSLARTSVPGAEGSYLDLSGPVTGLAEGGFYMWRSRIVTKDPRFPKSRWVSLPGNGITETKLRTAGCIDRDGDGYGALGDASCASLAADCNDAASTTWGTPGPVSGLLFSSKTQLGWNAPVAPGAAPATLTYDTLRSVDRTSFAIAACLEAAGADRITTDATAPSPGQGYFYLPRARNACPQGRGSLGAGSSGVPRVGSICP